MEREITNSISSFRMLSKKEIQQLNNHKRVKLKGRESERKRGRLEIVFFFRSCLLNWQILFRKKQKKIKIKNDL